MIGNRVEILTLWVPCHDTKGFKWVGGNVEHPLFLSVFEFSYLEYNCNDNICSNCCEVLQMVINFDVFPS